VDCGSEQVILTRVSYCHALKTLGIPEYLISPNSPFDGLQADLKQGYVLDIAANLRLTSH